MARNPRFDILFEPVSIGPVTAPNRFYQTPHATGMGQARPNSGAALRGVKAEGGWGVVCTEYCSIHPTSDDSPYAYSSLWDDDDVRSMALTVDAIHAHDSLAGIELWHGGAHTNNRLTREPVLAPSDCSAKYIQPGQVRGMDRRDINRLRRWHRDAAVRAKHTGADIVYVYAGHDYLPFQFLSRRLNRRHDEYGGPLENRARLIRELIEDTRAAVGDKCAVAVRLAVDELHGVGGFCSETEGREVIEILAELPDLWDIALGGSLGNDSCSSRFSSEGFQEKYMAFVKTVTTKPVVSVGRFTSPDTMVGQIKRGVQDFIGAARPSIADPFLPQKIDQGREEDIRECIGCNICRSANNEAVPLRCTQNPTIGEEWRRGWHPEVFEPPATSAQVLVVGGGPSGLEAALTLGRRGYQVTLAEAGTELGGRLLSEAFLPGLGNWIRVRDYRVHMLNKLPNVNIYMDSKLTTADIVEFGAEHVVIATGSQWRRDGLGAVGETPLPPSDCDRVLTPDDLFSGAECSGPVMIYDDEHYAMAGALAEKFLRQGVEVTFVTPETMVSSWTQMTDEQHFIQKQLLELGVDLQLSQRLVGVSDGQIETACVYTGQSRFHRPQNLVTVTGRESETFLYDSLCTMDLDSAGVASVRRVGDCYVPSSIADAVYSGHRYGRELEVPKENRLVRRERPVIPQPEEVIS